MYRPNRILRAVCGLLLLASVVLLVLAIVGHFLYTSAGIDLEAIDGSEVRCRYYRIRWPGNGSLWLGGGESRRRLEARPFCEFDWACSAWRKPERLPEPESLWNRVGFWWIVHPPSDPCNRKGIAKLTWGFWVGVPGWLPPLLLTAGAGLCWLQTRHPPSIVQHEAQYTKR